MVIRLVLEHHNSAAFDILRSKFKGCQDKLTALERSYRLLEQRYGAEVQYNAALIDLLRSHNIPFRDILSHDVRYRNAP